MKKIEKIEEICLSILAENKDPWVSIDMLLQKCREITGDNSIDEYFLISFLKNHSEVKVFDNFYLSIKELKNVFDDNEIKFQSYVILKRRLPNEKDMYIWIYNHLRKLLVLLESMESKAKNDTKKQQIGIVINKTNNLLERLKSLTVGTKEAE